MAWINKKTSDFDHIQRLLKNSYETGQMTNGGPLVKRLEAFFFDLLNIDEDRCVIATANGSLALHCLVSGINLYLNKSLNYCTQSFTFPSSIQGPLQGSHIVDLNQNSLSINLDLVPMFADGVIVTNLFGNVGPLDKIIQWAKFRGIILIFDNATVPFTNFEFNGEIKNVNNFGDGAIISLHNTKQIGFGEGGLIITDKKYEKSVRECINFGFCGKSIRNPGHPFGTNGKMSDISAAFIFDYVYRNFKTITTHTEILIKLFDRKLKLFEGKVKLFPNYGTGSPLLSCFALIFDKPINQKEISLFESEGISARKYYTPLNDLPVSNDLFSRILCLPLHLDINEETLDLYIKVIGKIIDQKPVEPLDVSDNIK